MHSKGVWRRRRRARREKEPTCDVTLALKHSRSGKGSKRKSRDAISQDCGGQGMELRERPWRTPVPENGQPMVPDSCSSSDVLSVAPDDIRSFSFFSFFFSSCATAQSKTTGAVFRQHHLLSLLQRRSPTATDKTPSKTATSERDGLSARIAPTIHHNPTIELQSDSQ